MSDIFISYANEDRDTAARFARLIESVGWRVWWDRRIPAGRTWRSILEDALREMRCLVVLGSKNSVQSSWVTEEAEEALRLGKVIVPVLIERVEPHHSWRTGELEPAEKLRLELSATYSDGKQALVKDGITWSSSASQVASISDLLEQRTDPFWIGNDRVPVGWSGGEQL